MFKNLSVSKKIAAGFLTLALIGAVAGGMSAYQTHSALDEVKTANNLSDLNVETAELTEKIAAQALSVKSFLLTGNRDLLTRSQDLNDEIQTGFGGSGKLWYYQHLPIKPDILVFGKKTQLSVFFRKRSGTFLEKIRNNPDNYRNKS